MKKFPKHWWWIVLAGVVVSLLLSAAGWPQEKRSSGPEINRIKRHGCAIDRVTVFKGPSPPEASGQEQWRVRVWADYLDGSATEPEHDWERTYSYRARREKAFKDCDEWMKEIESAQKKLKELSRR